jgi:uncharacterized membrane protein
MPRDKIIALIPVVLMFAFFAGAMIWADIYSRKPR